MARDLRLRRPCGCAISSFTGYPTPSETGEDLALANKAYLTEEVRTNGIVKDDKNRGGLTRRQYRDTVIYPRMAVIDAHY